MEDIQDPLKPLDQIWTQDRDCLAETLEDLHSILSAINLDRNIPLDVQQLFETSKNVRLYAFYTYRFHQVSEMVAFSSLELAIKELYTIRDPEKKQPLNLRALLLGAFKNGWIDNSLFHSDLENRTIIGIRRKRQKQADKEIKQHGKIITDPYTYISQNDLYEGISNSEAIIGYIDLICEIRNNLAHGSTTLHPNSTTTLKQNANLINHMYRRALQ